MVALREHTDKLLGGLDCRYPSRDKQMVDEETSEQMKRENRAA